MKPVSPTFIQRLKEIETLRNQLAADQNQFEQGRIKALAELPRNFGYASISEFIDALKKAANKRVARKTPKDEKKARKRIKITPEIKAKIIESTREGKTANSIATALGISVQSVHNTKKAAGLVKSRA